MSVWSELSGSCRVARLVQQPERLPPARCDLCGARVPSLEEHEREWCPVIARYGLVYFIQAGTDGPVKIGFTQQPVTKRLMQIRPSTPFALRLLLTVAGTRLTEKTLHKAWRDWRRSGEWFEPRASLLRGIADLQSDPKVLEEKRRFRVAHLDRLRFAAVVMPTHS